MSWPRRATADTEATRCGRRALVAKLFSAESKDRPTDRLTTYVNLSSYGVLRRDPSCLDAMDAVYADGFLMAWLLNSLGARHKRRSFDMTSMAAEVLQRAEAANLNIVLVGGEPGVAETAAAVLRRRFPSLLVAGTFSGYFADAEERARTIASIVALAPRIVVAGMGAGLQERMLGDLRAAGFRGEGYTCGGFLHQTANGRVHYYPRWMNELGLRWLYRCVREPKVLRRLAVEYPINALHLLQDYREWRQAVRRCGEHEL